MQEKLLDRVYSPADLKSMNFRELEKLCAEIREFLIENVSKTGGHLSSNLGMIEITVALHKCFCTPQDQIIFDVGHQCYTHKIITGRKEQFSKLRQAGGLSGFPSPEESIHDIFKAGHGSTSISAAIGLARAKKIKGERGIVIAVIGDGAFTGGMVYEGLNNISELDNLIVILNDNEMSISKNVGTFAHYLNMLRTSPQYYKAKSDVKTVLEKTPVIGSGVKKSIQSLKTALRRGIYHSTFFEDMGFQYVGPVSGHNLPEFCSVLNYLKKAIGPCFIHAETIKGKGFVPAENNPGAFHGVSAFNTEKLNDPDFSSEDSFSTIFGKKLLKLAKKDKKICSITAAMKYGTGLQYMKKNLPSRFFDVGMAEEHSVTFAAGLAKGGLKPVIALYSTFAQRAYDQIIHDVMLQKADVLFAIDRAGLVPGDGETHQGIYDVAFFSQHKNMPIVSVSNYAELEFWLEELLNNYSEPRVIRYPKGEEIELGTRKPCIKNNYEQVFATENAKTAIISYGVEIFEAIIAAEKLREINIETDVWQMILINPIPPEFVEKISKYDKIVFIEEGIQQGGIGEHLSMQLLLNNYKGEFLYKGVPETGIDHAKVPELKEKLGINAQGIFNMVCGGLE